MARYTMLEIEIQKAEKEGYRVVHKLSGLYSLDNRSKLGRYITDEIQGKYANYKVVIGGRAGRNKTEGHHMAVMVSYEPIC